MISNIVVQSVAFVLQKDGLSAKALNVLEKGD